MFDTTVRVVLGVGGVALFLLPSLVAFYRSSDDRFLVLVVNLLLGASVVGWFVAFYLAVRKPRMAPLSVETMAKYR